MISLLDEKHWLGTTSSFHTVMEADIKAEELMLAGQAFSQADIDRIAGPILTVDGSVAILDIKGSMVNGSAGFMRLFGVLGYDDIRAALAEAVADQNVKTVMLKIESGGGQVAGVVELGAFISSVDKVKPVFTYTENTMASAAYWLGVCGRMVMAGSTAIVGSIGVLMVHQEVSKMMAEMGVQTTIVRSGKYKALVNRYEPLSDVALAELQSQVDDLAHTFTSHVADKRDVSVEEANAKMGQGREFLGKRALAAGLVDQITSYSQAFKQVSEYKATDSNSKGARKSVAKSSAMANNSANASQGTDTMKRNLTPEQLAALAAGASLESLGLTAEQLAAHNAAVAEEQAAATAAAAEAARVQEEANTAAAAAAASAAAASAAAAANESPAVVAFLRGELKDANAELTATKAKLATLEASNTAMATEHAALTAIARKSLGTMSVALNKTASAELSGADLLTAHAKVSEEFQTRFKVGNVAATGAEVQTDTKPQVSPLFLQTLRNQSQGA